MCTVSINCIGTTAISASLTGCYWISGNVDFSAMQDEEVIVFFNDNCSKMGIADPVEAVRLVRDPASQLGKGFGFVQLRDQPAARVALGFDGQLLRKRPIRVTKAVRVPAHLKEKATISNNNKTIVSKGVRGGNKDSAGDIIDTLPRLSVLCG